MPELPDLEVIGSNLHHTLKGKKLEKLRVHHAKNIKVTEAELKKALTGHSLEKVYREGKELRFRFGGEQVLGVHLMLHGAFRFFDHGHEPAHTLVAFDFGEKTQLALTDFQGLANISLNPEEPEAPDALSSHVTPAFLKAQFASKKTAVKKRLTDQHVLRGIGNAYADEILWEAGISPFSVCAKIPDKAIHALAKAIPKVLRDAEKQIRAAQPGIIAGEVRDFLKIHHPRKEKSPDGERILHQKKGGTTYYTESQELYR